MTELKPILQGRPTRGEQRLLGSARIDMPRPGGAVRMVAALGLASGVTATAGASAASASSAGAAVLVKWLAIGAAAGAVVTGTGEAVQYGIEANREARPVVQQTAPASPAPGAKAPSRASFPGAPVSNGEEPSSVAAPASPGAQAAPPPNAQPFAAPPAERPRELAAAPITQPTLAEEVRALDAVRKLLAASDARGALRSLDDFSRRFTAPRLGPEAALLRQQARQQMEKP